MQGGNPPPRYGRTLWQHEESSRTHQCGNHSSHLTLRGIAPALRIKARILRAVRRSHQWQPCSHGFAEPLFGWSRPDLILATQASIAADMKQARRLGCPAEKSQPIWHQSAGAKHLVWRGCGDAVTPWRRVAKRIPSGCVKFKGMPAGAFKEALTTTPAAEPAVELTVAVRRDAERMVGRVRVGDRDVAMLTATAGAMPAYLTASAAKQVW